MSEAENPMIEAPEALPQVQNLDEIHPDQNPSAYNESSIQILEGLEAVRKRPGIHSNPFSLGQLSIFLV